MGHAMTISKGCFEKFLDSLSTFWVTKGSIIAVLKYLNFVLGVGSTIRLSQECELLAKKSREKGSSFFLDSPLFLSYATPPSTSTHPLGDRRSASSSCLPIGQLGVVSLCLFAFNKFGGFISWVLFR